VFRNRQKSTLCILGKRCAGRVDTQATECHSNCGGVHWNVGANPVRHIVKGGRAAVQNAFRIDG